NLFKSMLSEISRDVTSFLFKGSVPIQNPEQVQRAREQQQDFSRMKVGRGGIPTNGNQPPEERQEVNKPEPVRVGPKVGRNEPCPCGSGKKYKHCHGKS
ncbi:MAG: SEC-C domain-containing protein, partial [Bacteroidetes bacterium]|nr:SEC-C domain-containing protein [Bacteroidota bacterium]